MHSSERGAQLLETLLAIGLVAAMAPFVYNRVAEISRDIIDVSVARQINNFSVPMTGFIRANFAGWGDNAFFEMSPEILDTIHIAQIQPAVAFVEKFRHNAGATVEAYIVFPSEFDTIRTHRIARHLGMDAAVVDTSNVAFSAAGGWSIHSDGFAENDLVFRIVVEFPIDDSRNFLHRVMMSDEMMNTMERDILMARNNIWDIGTLGARILESSRIDTYFIAAQNITADYAIFPHGAGLDATNIRFGALRVMGDIFGFRNFIAGTFTGGGGSGNWAGAGEIIADRATFHDGINVNNNMIVNAPGMRTVSGFTALRAHTLMTPLVIADEMFFAGSAGIVISNELSRGGNIGPVRFGAWNFPASIAPRFVNINLTRTTLRTEQPRDLDAIMSSNWMEL